MIAINTPTKQAYDGDDATSEFMIPFPVFEPESVVVTLINADEDEIVLEYKVDYDLEKINVLGLDAYLSLLGGPLSVGEQLVIEHNRYAFQPVNLRTLGAFAPVEIEKALDRSVMSAKRTADYIDETFEDVVQLKLDMAEAQDDIVILEGRADSLETRATDLETDVASLEGRVEDAETNIQSLDTRTTSIENSLSDFDQRIDDVETTVQSLDTSVSGLNATVQTLDTAVQNLSNDVLSLGITVQSLDTSISALDQRVTDAENQIDGIAQDLLNVSLEVAGLDPRVDTLEADVADIKRTQYEINTISSTGTYLSSAGNLYVIRTSNTVVVQMPATPEIGDVVRIKSRASSNDITIDGNGNSVDGSSTFSLSSEDSSASIIFDGTEWLII